MNESAKKSDNKIRFSNSPSKEIITFIDELNDRAWNIRRNNNVESLETSLRAREMADSHSYLRGIAYSRLISGYCYSSIGDYKAALNEEKEALSLFEQLGEDKGKAWGLHFAGLIYMEEGEFIISIECYSKCLRIFEDLGDRQGMSSTVCNLGNIYYYLGDYTKALNYFQKALRMQEENGYRMDMGYSIMNIGAIHHQFEHYEDSIEYTSRALQIFQEDGDVKGQSLCLTNLGEFYRVAGELDKSITLQLKALEITRKERFKYHESVVFVNLGRTYFDAGEYEKAAGNYTDGLCVAREIEHKRCEGESLIGLGEVLCEQTKYEEAVDTLSAAVKIAEEGKFGEFIYKAHLVLSRTYERQGTFEPALQHYKEFFNARQKVFSHQVLQITEKTTGADDDALIKQKLLRLLRNLQIDDDDSKINPQNSGSFNQYLEKIAVKNNERIFFLKTEEVIWIEAAGDYASLQTRDKSYLIRERMGELERKLNPTKFLRIHRSTIINIDFIKEISQLFKGEYLVRLTTGKGFKVSRGYQVNLQKLLSRYS